MTWSLRRIGSAAVIVNETGGVLLVRHTYGRLNWEIPGGASEPGETVIQTAIREVREEAGIEPIPERLTGVYYEPEQDAHHFVFRCRISLGETPTPSSEEVSACEFWPRDALPRPISDFTIRRIDDALAGALPALPPTTVPHRAWLE